MSTSTNRYTQSEDRCLWILELAEFRKEDLVLEVDAAALTLRGSRAGDSGEVSVSHSVSLPGDADRERIQARFRDGTLTVTIPRAGGERRRVPIQ